jgi:membrane protein YqaA with SNARE-associated domain
MAGGDEFNSLKGAAGVAAALLFINSGTNGYDAFSAVMSSPWSTEKFTESPEEEAQARRYIRHAIVISGIYAGVGSVLAYFSGGWKLATWPVVGYIIVTAYMYWLYDQAVRNSPHGSY